MASAAADASAADAGSRFPESESCLSQSFREMPYAHENSTPLRIKIMLESNPPKSIILVGRLAVQVAPGCQRLRRERSGRGGRLRTFSGKLVLVLVLVLVL